MMSLFLYLCSDLNFSKVTITLSVLPGSVFNMAERETCRFGRGSTHDNRWACNLVPDKTSLNAAFFNFFLLVILKNNFFVPSTSSSSLSGSSDTFCFRLFSSFLNSRWILSISALRRGDGSIRITFGSVASLSFLWIKTYFF